MTEDEELREYARDVIKRVNDGEPVLLDPDKVKRLTRGFKVMGVEEILDRFLLKENGPGGT